MSAQNSAGIQTLLDVRTITLDASAEREASKIVQKGMYLSQHSPHPLHKAFRMQDVLTSAPPRQPANARDEAKKEIAEYKAKKEDEFQKFGAEHSKGNEQAEAEAAKEADAQIKTIKEAGSKGQATVVKNLLSAVFDVAPVAPGQQ
ncbi:hypothetical protein E4U43_001474 [Claviceps pusilla]|uniref:V-type proton ATPase subunit G n=1 Tax=Claviceps pusilla TaxID=123648 RepID=A0A9P7SY74_9HYPO|nr:hypothetical protein E4U43_001474 [Claviceps pusilla]